MMLLLAAALPIALATQGEMFITRDNNGVTNYLLIKALGRKNLFGEAEWSAKRGTAMRWQWETEQVGFTSSPNLKIQVLGKFKKKNLCLYWRGNYAQPFSVKKCAEVSNALKFGCHTVGVDVYFGKKANADAGDVSKMQQSIYAEWTEMNYSNLSDAGKLNTATVAGAVCWHPTMQSPDVPTYEEEYNAANFKLASGKGFTLMTDKDGPVRWFGVRQSNKDKDANGNAGGDVWAWSATQRSNVAPDVDGATKAAVLQWKGDYIQVIGPSHARTDGKPLCLKLDRSKAKISKMPLRVQKCDNTIEDGKFGCHLSDDGLTYFGMKWNAKKLAAAESSSCPHEGAGGVVDIATLNAIQLNEYATCFWTRQSKIDEQKARMRTQFYSMVPGVTVPNYTNGPCFTKYL